jgi:hypothetical protein
MERNHTGWHSRTPGLPWRIARVSGLIVVGVALAALFALLLGVVAQWLWNWLIPDIFGLKQITYWQAFGLLFLGRLLFGGFGHHGRSHHPHRFKRRGGGDGSDRWEGYGRFWHDKGKEAVEDIVERVASDKHPGEEGP